MIRLLATDVDGTLFDPSRRVSERNRSSLQRLSATGVVICLASGRLVPTLLPIVDEIGIPGPLIACNGAFAQSEQREVLFHVQLSSIARDAVLDYAERYGVTTNVYQPHHVLASHDSEMLELYRSRTRAAPELHGWQALRTSEATKIIFIDHPERNLEHLEHFRPLAGSLDVHLTVSEPEYLEFLPGGVSKRTSLQAVARHLGLARDEVAAVGDYFNDLEMVEWAGLGGAMGNAPDELKAVADIVVPGNDEDGLAVFVDHVLALNAS